MKCLITLSLLLCWSVNTFACDEQCKRERAMKSNHTEFPNYLTWDFCESTKMAFMERDIPSLISYRKERMTTKYRGSMRNTKNFVAQREGWLKECNDYMVMTGKDPLFKDKKTTNKIFSSMKSVTKELDALISGVTYTTDTSNDNVAVAGDKFDELFKLVDDHKTLLMIKGQFIARD